MDGLDGGDGDGHGDGSESASGGGLRRVNETYARLETEVLGRYERAERVGKMAARGAEVVRVLRGVQRCVVWARRVETAVGGSGILGGVPTAGGGGSGRGVGGKSAEDHERVVEASLAILGFRQCLLEDDRDGELGRVALVRQVRGKVVEDGEEKVRDWARRVVREFNAVALGGGAGGGSNATGGGATVTLFRDAELAKARFTSACRVLYLLSPATLVDGKRRKMKKSEFEAELLLRSLQGYVHSAVQASGAGIARGLAALPQLERVLLEVSSRCQSLVAMERVLESIPEPEHLLLEVEGRGQQPGSRNIDKADGSDDEEEDDEDEENQSNLLQPLLHALDTPSLPSYFWRSIANGLGGKVQEILLRGGVSARTLRSQRDAVREALRDCVLRGSRVPAGMAGGETVVLGNWEREAAVMVGSVMSALGR